MSTVVWGAMIIRTNSISDDDLLREEKIKLAFRMIKIAAENEIGIDFGDRVHSWVQQRYRKSEHSKNYIPFQLVNDSLNPNTDALFASDKVKEEWNLDDREDRGERLDFRMSRIQRFLEEVVKIDSIESIILNVDVFEGSEFPTIEIKAKDFKARIIELYEKQNYLTPSVRFIIG